MKIIIVCGAGMVSGKEVQMYNIMVSLKKMGHSIYCIMSSWGSMEFERMLSSAAIPYCRLRIGFISVTFSFSAISMTLHQLLYIPLLWWKFRSVLKVKRPDVVLHTNFHHVFILLPVLVRSKHVFYVHDDFANRTLYRKLFKLFNRRIIIFIGVSKFICKNILKLGIPERKIVLIYNGIPVPELAIKQNRNVIPVIGIVGQIGSWKGHHILVEALAGLKHLAWSLNIIGEGGLNYRLYLESLIQSHGLQDRISFCGRLTGLGNIYGELDIVCVPSVSDEPFGLVAVEPGFFSIPVVCSDSGALPEVVLNNQTGFIVKTNSVLSLREAIATLIINPQLRNSMGGAALKEVTQRFGIEESTLKLIKVISN